MRILLDTNVLVSAALGRGTPRTVVLTLVGNSAFTWLVSAVILAEYERVLSSPRLRLLPEEISEWTQIIEPRLTVVDVPSQLAVPALRDQSDEKWLQCAMAGNANCLITGDRDFESVPEELKLIILTPAGFLRLLG